MTGVIEKITSVILVSGCPLDAGNRISKREIDRFLPPSLLERIEAPLAAGQVSRSKNWIGLLEAASFRVVLSRY